MVKKIFVMFVLCLTACLAFTACSGDDVTVVVQEQGLENHEGIVGTWRGEEISSVVYTYTWNFHEDGTCSLMKDGESVSGSRVISFKYELTRDDRYDKDVIRLYYYAYGSQDERRYEYECEYVKDGNTLYIGDCRSAEGSSAMFGIYSNVYYRQPYAGK